MHAAQTASRTYGNGPIAAAAVDHGPRTIETVPRFFAGVKITSGVELRG